MMTVVVVVIVVVTLETIRYEYKLPYISFFQHNMHVLKTHRHKIFEFICENTVTLVKYHLGTVGRNMFLKCSIYKSHTSYEILHFDKYNLSQQPFRNSPAYFELKKACLFVWWPFCKI